MSATLPRVDDPSDAELISAVRGGDVDAYGELFARHVGSARRLARQLVSGPDVDDLVSEAFAKTLVVLQRGGGPDLAFRAYLLTAVRRLHVDRIRATSRLHHTDDLTPFDPGVPFRDTAVEGFENATAARAFASLPERWQLVLWHTEVEGQKPAEIAPLLGLSANSVSALAYRAREGLRQAFLSMHAQDTVDASCAWAQEHLGSYVRGGLSRRDSTRVEAHLEECRRCAAVYLELTEINSGLSGLLAPLLLGGAAAAYLGSVAAGAGPGALALLLGRARDLVLAHASATATATAGVAASALVAGVLLHPFGSPDGQVPADAPGVGTSSPSAGPAPQRTQEPPGGPITRQAGTGPFVVLTDAIGTADPTPTAATGPTGPGDGSPSPSGHPSAGPPPDGPGTGPGSGPGARPDMDLAVSASATPSSGVAFEVAVTVTGLAPGRTATLTVSSDHTSVTLTPDRDCGGLAIGHGSCTVTADPSSYTFLVAAPPDAPTVLTFSVRPDGRAVESDPSDNTTRVELTP